jgi:hypothetical protein
VFMSAASRSIVSVVVNATASGKFCAQDIVYLSICSCFYYILCLLLVHMRPKNDFARLQGYNSVEVIARTDL